MILDQLDPNVIASYAPEFQRAFEAIARLNGDAPLGKFEIDGDRIYGNVMEYDAVQPRAQTGRKGKVRIRRRVRASQLDPRLLSPGRRHPDQRASARPAPGDIGGRFIAGHQPLIGIDQRIGDRAQRPDMLHQTPDKIVGFSAQTVFILRILKNIFPVL